METVERSADALDQTRLDAESSRIFYLSIDSRDRDRSLYPDPHSYVVPFADTLTNVVQVELVYAQYDKYTDEFYMNMVIEECAPNSIASNTRASNVKAFTQLPLTQIHNEYHRGMYRSIKFFDPPKAKLDRLTITFLTTRGAKAGIKDHFLRFEITSMPARIDAVPRGFTLPQAALIKVLAKMNKRLHLLDKATANLAMATTGRHQRNGPAASRGTRVSDDPDDDPRPALNSAMRSTTTSTMRTFVPSSFTGTHAAICVAVVGVLVYMVRRHARGWRDTLLHKWSSLSSRPFGLSNNIVPRLMLPSPFSR